MWATAKNKFTLFPSVVTVRVELYISDTYQDNYTNMTLVASNYINDLDRATQFQLPIQLAENSCHKTPLFLCLNTACKYPFTQVFIHRIIYYDINFVCHLLFAFCQQNIAFYFFRLFFSKKINITKIAIKAIMPIIELIIPVLSKL